MENRYRTKFFGESIPKEDGYFVSDFNDAIQNGKNVKMKDDGLVSKKTPVKVKMKIRDFEAIIYKMIEILLPKANIPEDPKGKLKMLEIYAFKNSNRRGWIHLSEE